MSWCLTLVARLIVLQYTKLRLWELDEFSRIVYLDADTLVMGDITPLFHIPHAFAAVRL